MYALVDCNSFFCSVEKAFHPGLRGKPVCVLSNNDGCIVALTPEAKALGLRRGDPIFRVRNIIRQYGVKVFSSNIHLYAAMSRRITSILRQSIPHVENYSIDESFCDLNGCERQYDPVEMMRRVGEKVTLWTDIPVSIGVAPTKTLAKIGSKFAKKHPGYRGVCAIMGEEKRRRALALTEPADIWGIGRHTLEKLYYYGIHTSLELADKSESWVRAQLKKPGVQTWMELNGVPCIDTNETKRNQTICTSRSFGQMISDLPSLKSAVASFAGSCAGKLRGQGSAAGEVTVFVASNRFRDDLPQYSAALSAPLLMPTADTIEINRTAMQLLERLYRPDILYKKAGVAVSNIVDVHQVQPDLFDPIHNRQERARLMTAMDRLNQHFGLKTIHLAVEGEKHQTWHSNCAHRSPDYLTNINEILTIHI